MIEGKSKRSRSPLWTAVLLPFLFLPYRWLWLPCALGAALLVRPSKQPLRELLRQDGTMIFGSLLVLVLRTALDFGWWTPWAGVILGLLLYRSRKSPSGGFGTALVVVIVAFTWLLLTRPDLSWLRRQPSVPGSGVLVCAGDSLTSGVNLKSDAETYVAGLRGRWPDPVLNAGYPNDKVRDLRKRLDRDVLSQHPAVVLLFIGGNDYLDGTPRSQFAAVLEEVAGRIAASGARLVIVEVPTGIIWNPYAGIYRQVAKRYGAGLVPESRLRLWFSIELLLRQYLSEPLTIDGIHLSPAGAARVANWLEPYIRTAAERS